MATNDRTVRLQIEAKNNTKKAFVDLVDLAKDAESEINKLVNTLDRADVPIEELADGIRELEGTLARLSAGKASQYFEQQKKLAGELLNRYDTLNKKLVESTERQKQAAEAGKSITAQQKVAYQQLQQRVEKANDAYQRQVKIVGDIQRQLGAKALSDVTAKEKQQVDQLSKSLVTLRDRYAKLKEVQPTYDPKGARQSLDFFQRLRGQILSLVAAYTGLYGAVNQFNKSLEEGQKLQGAQARLGIALQTDDLKVVNDELQFAREEADRLGLALVPLTDQYSKFAVAATQAGVSIEETRVIFRSMAETGIVMNATTEDMEGIFRALTQIMSKGRLTAEELRGQLGERFPAAVAIMAKSLGKTQAQLAKMMEQGQLTSDVLLKFSSEATKSIKSGLEPAMTGLRAELGRTETAMSDARKTFFDFIAPDLIKFLRELREELGSSEFQESLKSLAKIFIALANALVFVIKNFEYFVAILIAFKGPAVLLNLSNAFANNRKVLIGWYNTLVSIADFFVKGGAASMISKMGLFVKSLFEINKAAGTAAVGITSFVRVVKAAFAATGIGLAIFALSELISYLVELGTQTDEVSDQIADSQQQLLDSTKERIAAQKAALDEIIANMKNVSRTMQTSAREAKDALVDMIDPEATNAQLKKLESDLKQTLKNLRQQFQESLGKEQALSAQLGKTGLGPDARLSKEQEINREIDKSRSQLADAIIATEKRLNEVTGKLRKKDLADAQKAYDDFFNFLQDQQLEIGRIDLSPAEKEMRDIEKAFTDYERNVSQSTKITGEQKKTLLELAAALKTARMASAEYAKSQEDLVKQTKDAESALDASLKTREAALDEVERRANAGLISEVEAQAERRRIFTEYNGLILTQIDRIIQFYTAISGPESDEAIATLNKLKGEIKASSQEMETLTFAGVAFSKKVLANEFAQGLTNAFMDWADGIKSANEALKEFASNFLRFIAEAIVREQALAIARSLFGVAHEGGIAGQLGHKKSVSPAAFIGATRYHTGGVVGLAPNEVPAILQRGEEVLTRDDPRHIANGGTSQQAAPAAAAPVTVINTIDKEALAQTLLSLPAFTKGIVNVVQANKRSIQQGWSG